jgi:hypothetical protein
MGRTSFQMASVAKAPAEASMARAMARQGAGLGNQARLRRLTPVAPHLQAKLQVGAVDDPLEREADAVADQVMRAPVQVSRKCAECDDEKKPVQRKAAGAPMPGGGAAPPIVSQALSAAGRPLDAPLGAYISQRFGRDFSGVRIHTDSQAQASAEAVGAAAYTVGQHLVFGAGRYDPGSDAGRRLIAHELAHTVQQGGASDSLRRDPPDTPDAPLKEAKKEDATTAVTGGLKTVADAAGKDDKLKQYGLGLAKQYALPIWNGASDGDKAAMVVGGAAIYGTGVAAMLSNPAGRNDLSGINFIAPLGLIPYATLTGFSFDTPKTKTEPFLAHLSFKGDDLLDLAHQKLSYFPSVSLSFDMTLSVSPDGKVTTPFAMAKFGVLPGVSVTAGFGVASDLPTLTAPASGGPLAPYKDFPQPATPAPRGGEAVFVSVDLLKAPFLPKAVRSALGAEPDKK